MQNEKTVDSFATLAEAEACVEALGSDKYGVYYNMHKPGWFDVEKENPSVEDEWRGWGDYLSKNKCFIFDENIIDQDEKMLRGQYEKMITEKAIKLIASKMSGQTLSTEAKFYFEAGFIGVPAKQSNPRKMGFEEDFRAGRTTRQQKGVDRLIRVATAKMRASGPSFSVYCAALLRDKILSEDF